jgi:hypothetical protein
VRVAVPEAVLRDPVVYSANGMTFEVGRHGRDWLVAVRDSRGLERVARFDEHFTEGDIVVSESAAARGLFPLAAPLDELLLVHRLAREDGLVLRGSAVWRDRRAIVFLGGEPASIAPFRTRPGVNVASTRDRVILRTSDSGVRAFAAPWDPGTSGIAPLSGRVDAIHSIVSAPAVFSDRLDDEEALDRIIAHALAPVHEFDGPDRLLEVASRLAARVPVLRLGLPRGGQVIPFTWGQSQAAVAFAPPTGGV